MIGSAPPAEGGSDNAVYPILYRDSASWEPQSDENSRLLADCISNDPNMHLP